MKRPKVPGATLEAIERWAILRTLVATESYIAAADVLKCSVRKIENRVRAWGIKPKAIRSARKRYAERMAKRAAA